MTATSRIVCSSLLLLAIGCGGSTKEPQSSANASETDDSVDHGWDPSAEDKAQADQAKPEDQVRLGATLFTARCASCHGNDGEGDDGAPALIGDGALPEAPSKDAKTRTAPFGTAKDLHEFVLAEMPPGDGKLGDEEAWAVVAYLASANGIKAGVMLDAESGGDVSLARSGDGDEDDADE